MKSSEFINEIPQTFSTYKPNELHNKENNHELYLQFSRMPNKDELFSLSATSKVYIHSKEIYCLDSSIQRVTYDMEFNTKTDPLIGTFVWQASVWHSKIDPITTGLPDKVFFEYLIPTYGTVLTDSRQSWDGARYWMGLIPKAFDKGLQVYYVDFEKRTTQHIPDVGYWKSFYAKMGDIIWTPATVGKMRRMAITTKSL